MIGVVGWVVVGVVGLGAVAFAAGIRARRTAARDYAERVGLDLADLVALLPEALRDREWLRFEVGPSEPAALHVGLVYRDAARRVGNPANVGLSFDRRSGALVEVHPDGVGLGYK